MQVSESDNTKFKLFNLNGVLPVESNGMRPEEDDIFAENTLGFIKNKLGPSYHPGNQFTHLMPFFTNLTLF